MIVEAFRDQQRLRRVYCAQVTHTGACRLRRLLQSRADDRPVEAYGVMQQMLSFERKSAT